MFGKYSCVPKIAFLIFIFLYVFVGGGGRQRGGYWQLEKNHLGASDATDANNSNIVCILIGFYV